MYPFVKHCTKRVTLLASAALALGGAGAARAQTQTFTFSDDLSGAKVVTLTDNGGANYFSGYAGQYKGQIGSAPTTNVFCVDVSHEIHSGDTYAANTQYAITNPAGSLSGGYYKGGLASALTDGDLASVTMTQAGTRSSEVAYLADNFLDATSFSGASGSADAVTNFTALNLGIWDIVRDGGDGLSAGQLQAGTPDATTYGGLVSYYEGLATQHSSYLSDTAYWVQAPQQTLGQHLQDYVYEKPAGPQAVPEPGMPTTLSCLALVVGGLWLRRRRRQTA